VQAAAVGCLDVNLLVNNAGLFTNHRLVLTDDPDAARREMEVNYFGVLNMTRAFAPVLGADGGGYSRTVRFVPAAGGRTGIVAVDLHATDREHGVGRNGELCHTLIIRLV
jgi:NAD(P)-dependent dehydrogenase (short-subunit alcohol dehydrogenase family)